MHWPSWVISWQLSDSCHLSAPFCVAQHDHNVSLVECEFESWAKKNESQALWIWQMTWRWRYYLAPERSADGSSCISNSSKWSFLYYLPPQYAQSLTHCLALVIITQTQFSDVVVLFCSGAIANLNSAAQLSSYSVTVNSDSFSCCDGGTFLFIFCNAYQ